MGQYRKGLWIGALATAVVFLVIPIVAHSMPDRIPVGDQPPIGDEGVADPVCPFPPDGYLMKDPGIPGGGLCRGACGPDCVIPNDCQNLSPHKACFNYPSGAKHIVCTYSVVECGSNDGCKEHDACYDTCYRNNNNDLSIGICKRGCDLQCLDHYGLICNDWRTGDNYKGGTNTHPELLDYVGLPSGEVLPGLCS